MYLVDDRGEIIDQYGPQYADLDLPIVDGLAVARQPRTTSDRCRTGRTGGARHQRAQSQPGRRPAGVADRRPRSAQRAGDSERGRGGHLARRDQFLERIESYLELAPTLRDRVAEIDHVDVRFENRIYVRQRRR